MRGRKKSTNFCHRCSQIRPPRFLVACQNSCGMYFCKKCLIRYYKYSREKCSKLPSPNWKCPACSKKCGCQKCNSEKPTNTESETVLKNKGLLKKKLKKRNLNSNNNNENKILITESNCISPFKIESKLVLPKIADHIEKLESESTSRKSSDHDKYNEITLTLFSHRSIFPQKSYESMNLNELLAITFFPFQLKKNKN